MNEVSRVFASVISGLIFTAAIMGFCVALFFLTSTSLTFVDWILLFFFAWISFSFACYLSAQQNTYGENK